VQGRDTPLVGQVFVDFDFVALVRQALTKAGKRHGPPARLFHRFLETGAKPRRERTSQAGQLKSTQVAGAVTSSLEAIAAQIF
jgi:hypothetical protein